MRPASFRLFRSPSRMRSAVTVKAKNSKKSVNKNGLALEELAQDKKLANVA